VQQHLLIRSDKAKTGYKGVRPLKGRYQAQCTTPPCHDNYLGNFGTSEEGAQAYLQHQQHSHNHQAAPPLCLKDEGRHGWLRMFNALHEKEQQQQPCVGDRISVHWPEEGQWFSGRVFEVSEDDSSYCVVYDDGDKQWHSWQGDRAPDWRVDDGKAVEVKEGGKKRKLSGCDEEEQHLLIRSDKSSTGYRGVHPHQGRYQAKCQTPPCLQNYLGTFDTSEEAAQAYLQHYQEEHPEELKVQHQYPVEDYPAVLHPQYCLSEVAKWTQKQGVTLPAVTYGCGGSHSVLARPRHHPVTRLVEDRLKMTLP
jgi:hypothetical protein